MFWFFKTGEIIQKLGKGCIREVHIVKDLVSGALFTIKSVIKDNLEHIENHLIFEKALENNFLPTNHNWFFEVQYIHIVAEYCKNTSLML
jgi:hypothetical protein